MKRAWLHGGIVPRSVPFCVRRHSINKYLYIYISTLYDVISGPASLCRMQCIRVPPLYTVELFIFIFFPNSLIDSRHCVRSLFALSGTYYYYVCMCTYSACLVGRSADRRKGTMMCFGGSFIHVFIYYVYRYDSCK